MSDIKSELPIRSQLPNQANFDDVLIRVADGTDETKVAKVDSHGSQQSTIADNSGNVIESFDNAGQYALGVGIDVGGAQIDPRQIRTLTDADHVTSDQGAPNTAANGWPVKPTDGTNSQSYTAAGEAKVDVTQPLPAGTNTIGKVAQDNTTQWVTSDLADGPVAPGTAASKSMLAGAQFNVALPTLTDTQQSALQLTAKGELITIPNVGNNPVSSTNPMPVSFSSAPLGAIVNDYNTVSALAAGSSSNHDYTITSGKTFQGKKIWATASALLKIEVQISTDGTTFNTKWVGFNSISNPNISIDLNQMVFLDSGTGAKIRVIRTNKDNKPQDVYSTISGTEV